MSSYEQGKRVVLEYMRRREEQGFGGRAPVTAGLIAKDVNLSLVHVGLCLAQLAADGDVTYEHDPARHEPQLLWLLRTEPGAAVTDESDTLVDAAAVGLAVGEVANLLARRIADEIRDLMKAERGTTTVELPAGRSAPVIVTDWPTEDGRVQCSWVHPTHGRCALDSTHPVGAMWPGDHGHLYAGEGRDLTATRRPT